MTTPTPEQIRARTGFEHKSDPALIARVIEMKRRTRYYAGEGFRVDALRQVVNHG